MFKNIRLIIIISFILIASLSRLLPHEPNVTPIMALSLFSGTFIDNKRLAYIVPILAMLISDLIIGIHPLIFVVYLSILISVSLGFVLKKKLTLLNTIGIAFLSSFIFFLITNFAHWVAFYEIHNFQTLFKCYIDAIPFYRNSLIGDGVYTLVLFGGYKLAEKFIPQLSVK